MSLEEIKEQVFCLASASSKTIDDATVCKSIISYLAKYYRTNVYWFEDDASDYGGYFKQGSHKPGIYINNYSKMHHLCIFFHEAGHLYAVRNGLWKAYHERPIFLEKGQPRFHKRTARIAKQTGYRAECWVDRWAIKELAKWYPNFEYETAYLGCEDSAQWLLEKHLIPCYDSSL